MHANPTLLVALSAAWSAALEAEEALASCGTASDTYNTYSFFKCQEL